MSFWSGMKGRGKAVAAGCAVAVIALVLLMAAVFRQEKSLDSVLPFGLSEVTGYQIYEMVDGGITFMTPADQGGLLENLERIRIANGVPDSIRSIHREKGDQIFQINLVRNCPDGYDLEKIVLYQDQYIYLDDTRYTVKSPEIYTKVLEICAASLKSSGMKYEPNAS